MLKTIKHPNILDIHAFNKNKKHVKLVMEYADYGKLVDIFKAICEVS